MPIVTTNFSNQYDVFTHYKKRFDVGPLEFLNLLYHAKFVLATSFHGTVFSVLFNKPFFAINGEQDARIAHLLKKCALQNCAISLSDCDEKILNSFNISFETANKILLQERKQSISFLKNALNDKGE